ncbi:imelysin family protein [Dyadobacter sp. CY261]|uniref:imelysin family protein n=1 Tax=Dyadobacter sp. CY261 TaxID=2907203 RepID=UPI001F40FF24|nr:imelysin family protein [Dyadobacter sp. CY261]MCF0072954.1 imelysin family protein [Dyadobacter sp. CY261]
MKRFKKLAYALVTGILVLGCSSKDNPDPGDETSRVAMLQNVGNNVIIPSFEAFQTNAKALTEAATAYAADVKSETKLAAVQNAWLAMAQAWKTASLFTQGPIDDDFLGSSIYFNTLNTTAIEKAVSQPGGTVDDAYIEGLGAASKGIRAIEYMLFSTSGNAAIMANYSGINGAGRGNYLKALCANLQKQAETVTTKWKSDGGNYIKTFIEANGRDINSSFGVLANKMIDLVYTIKDERLGAPIGKRNNGTPQPGLVDAPLSNASLALLKAEVQSLENAFTGKAAGAADGPGIDDILDEAGAKSGDQALSAKIKGQFATVYAKIESITVPLSTAVTTQKDQVNAAYDEVKKLQVMMEVDMINNLGVLLTFSDNDGD